MPVLTLAAVPAAAAISRQDWERLCPAGHPFLNADFLTIVETHGAASAAAGWQASHLLARDAAGQTVGILPLYLKSHSHGEFIRDWQWAGAYRQLGRRYYPKLLTGLPHTPVVGPRLLVAPGPAAAAIRQVLADGALALAHEHQLSSWHVALPGPDDTAFLQGEGLLTSHDVQFQWHDMGYGDFAGYLATFSAAKRRKVRAERQRVATSGLTVETRHGDAIDPREWPALHALYAATFDKFGNHAAFSAPCLAALAGALGRRMVAFIARDRGEPVALALCFRDDQALYGRYWGCRGHYPGLHFELCFYQGIAYCLAQGLARFEPGAGGEHKLARGFQPTVVRSLHWIADPAMARLIGQYLERSRDGVLDYRDAAAQHLPFRQRAAGSP